MLFDEWHKSSQQQQQQQQQPRGQTSGNAGNMGRQPSMAHLHDGYESDEERGDLRGPTSFGGGSLMNRQQSQGTSGLHPSSIITGPNDPSLAPLDQVGGLPSHADSAMFQLERLDWRPSKEQGAIVGLATANGVLFIATQNCNVIRWNVETDEFEEIIISKRADDRIHKVFLDPTGSHGVIAMQNGQVYYMHRGWNKAHLLSKVKGVIIESIAWNNAFGTEASTKKILIGTNRGLIYETCIEEKDKYFKKIHDLIFDDTSATSTAGVSGSGTDLSATTPVSGLHFELFPSTADAGEAGWKWFVMAATPNRQFQFIGGPTFEALFSKYTGNIPNSFSDFPGDLTYSELRTFSSGQGSGKAATANACAWMNGVGIYYGNLVFAAQDKGQDVLQNGKLLAYPSIPDPIHGGMRPQPPVSLTLTEFHFLLVMKNRLLAINQLSEEIVYEEVFSTSAFGEMQGLATDSRRDTVWLYSDRFVFAVKIEKEDRDAWKLYLADSKFDLALDYTDTDQQAERVNNAKADYLFEQGAFEAAAKIYAETGRSFEEVALKFVNMASGLPVPLATTLGVTKDATASSSSRGAGGVSSSSGALLSPISLSRSSPQLQAEARSALKAYLMAKLVTLDPTELTQQVMICTWLTEIFLDNINRLQEGTVESAASLLRKRGSTLAGKNGLVSTTSPFPDMESTLALAAEEAALTGVGASTAGEESSEDLAMQAEERAQAREDEVREFRAFLVEYFDCLNKETTFELISSHGRIHELVFYAETIGDFEWVLNYHIQQGNYFQALDILAEHEAPGKILDKFYKFTPTLMYYLPAQTVDLLCDLGRLLDPAKLIPALMRYEDSKEARDAREAEEADQSPQQPPAAPSRGSKSRRGDDGDGDVAVDRTNHAIRYLEHMILKLKNRDPVIHNYLISLYAHSKSAQPLDAFLASQTSAGGKISFDYKYALRVCHESGKYRACVRIYEAMKMYEEATRMALEIDLELAKSVVAKAQAESDLSPSAHVGLDDHQRKRLWILIARHVIEHEQDISKAMKILKECDVRLEEILPFFPDFVRIGEFKSEICKSLDQYNAKIEHLKSEMEEYTDSANLIRADINGLRSRYGVVTSNQKCDLCSQTVLTRQFLLFPCTHTFHSQCAVQECAKYLNGHPQRKAQVMADAEFQESVHASAAPIATTGKGAATTPSELSKEAREQKCIENFASSECCLCGEIIIDSVSNPFIALPQEEAEALAWEI